MERLRLLMERLGVDQSELARRTGFDQTTISRWLDPGPGHRNPRPQSIGRVAKGLNVDPAWEFIEYRRWLLHQQLDEWIDQDEDTVQFLLSRLRPGQGRPT